MLTYAHLQISIYMNVILCQWFQAKGLKVVCVLYFCAEGDNVPDAFLIADVVQWYLHHGMLIGESLGFLYVHVQMMLGHILTMNIFYMPYL
jgi:hypothetical protein